MNALFREFELKGLKVKNRIVMPPLVNFNWSDDNGFVTERHIKHYERRAKGEAGIIIVEATAINKNGRLLPTQLGIWSDEHIEGMKKITTACHKYGTVILLQIHHGGLNTHPKAAERAAGPSVDPNKSRSYSLSVEEIKKLTHDFIEGAVRAKKAGFDGVEIHGAHMYLLCQFATPLVNKRTDEYGETLEGRLKFAKDIITGIRNETGTDFIISYRLGANAPGLEDGINIANELEHYGVNILHVSHGGMNNPVEIPPNFNYNWIVFSGTEIKKHVHIPVIVARLVLKWDVLKHNIS